MYPLTLPDFRPRSSDSVLRLTSLSRLYLSLINREGQPDLQKKIDALSRAMFRKAASEATPLVDRLHLLSSLYDLLTGTSYIVDRQKTDRWDILAEKVIKEGLPAAKAGDEPTLVALCCCLTDYFYFDPSPEEDPWFLFLRDTVTMFGEGLTSSKAWPGLSLEEALARLELLNRYSYMFLEHRWDKVVAEAFQYYKDRALDTSSLSWRARLSLYDLSVSGNAYLLNEVLADTLMPSN